MKVPDVVIIGAQKSGTSTFYRNLVQIPELQFTRQKESNILIQFSALPEIVDAYAKAFQENRSPRIDVAPKYAQQHLYSGAAERLYSINPKARIVYLVRDPIERIKSQLHHNALRDRIHKPMADEALSNPDYVLTSSYFYQIAPFLDRFPLSQILVYTFEDMIRDPMEFQRIWAAFIGVSYKPMTMKPFNVSSRRYVIKYHDAVHGFFTNNWILKGYHQFWRLVNIKPPAVVLSTETQTALYSILQEDIKRFCGIFHVNAASWKTYTKMEVRSSPINYFS